MRPRKIMLIGNSYFIKLVPQDLIDLKLAQHDEVDIEDINKVNNELNTKRDTNRRTKK